MSTPESFQFEGAEKLLEIWFAPPSSTGVERPPTPPTGEGRYGLRTVKRAIWEEMLDIVKCKVLSVVEGSEIDAYLLRSVSPFYRLQISRASNTLLGFYSRALSPVDHQRILAVRLSLSSHPQNMRNDAQPLRFTSHP